MTPVTDNAYLTAVAFRSAGQRYAVPVDRVREIQQIVAFAEVPDETGTVLGMIDLRGEIVPAVDVRILLGSQLEPHTVDNPMIVLESDRGTVALVVDQVDTVFDVTADSLEPAPGLHPLSSRMLGVCRLDEDLLFVLNVDALLEPFELVCPEEVASGE